jgi:uridine kinase
VTHPLVARLGLRVREAGRASPRVLAGVDGPDAAGKTTLADALADALADRVSTRRASMDDFLRPPGDRHRRGALSAEGYYHDAFNVDAFVEGCAQPFLSGDDDGVLIVDGVFLLRPELAHLWTVSIYLRVSPEESLRRALTRDLARMGSADEVRRRYLARYLPGQAIYREEVGPESVADIVIDNERVDAPRVLSWRVSGDAE